MPCLPLTIEGQFAGFACTGRTRKRYCGCGAVAPLLCDGPPPRGSKRTTCSKPICVDCATKQGGLDICPTCNDEAMLTPCEKPGCLGHTRAPGGQQCVKEATPPVGLARAAAAPPPAAASGRPAPTRCRSCNAEIHWTEAVSGRRMPVDATPVATGNLVLSRSIGAGGALLIKALAFDPALHATRERWVSHFSTCPQGKQWRRP